MKRLGILFFILILGVLGFYLYYKEGTLPVNPKTTESKIFVIKKGATVTDIAKDLEKEELIRNKIVFYFIIKKLGIAKNIQAGDYRLNQAMSADEIAKSLTRGTLDIWITIIEGLRKEEIAQIFSREFGIPESEFNRVAREGYLFPDTYLIPKNASLDTILSIFKTNFQNKYNAQARDQAEKLGLSEEEIIKLASLVEKEGRSDEARRQVASILLRRYKNDHALNVDATIQYALGYQINNKTWWKKDLTEDDLQIDSPYNTYTNAGLPPTPICNPGLSAIRAVLAADQNTPYFYYITSKDGSVMHYARTLDEHNENIRKYLR